LIELAMYIAIRYVQYMERFALERLHDDSCPAKKEDK